MSLVIKNLHFSVKDKVLLKSVNANVETAKLIGVIGPNGAGKSTLLKCISGLLPTNNCVYFNNQSIDTYTNAELAQTRAALPQDSGLNFPFKGRDIVEMSFAYSCLSISEQQQLLTECLTMMSASALSDRNFLNLSGGEKQRIQLARVLAQILQKKDQRNMRLLLLDEPTAPLDLKYQLQLFKCLKAMVKQNVGVIIAIHDINLASSYCDEIWVMKEGQLIIQQPPHRAISDVMMKQVFEVDVHVSYDNNNKQPIIGHII